MKKVLFRGPALTSSGYGVHSRQVIRWLLDVEKQGKISVNFQVLPWGDTPWILDGSRHDGLIEEIMKRTTQIEPPYDVSFQLQLPNEWDPKLAKFNVGLTAGVETDKCNPEWVSCCNKMQKIVVPSKHTLQTLKNSGLLFAPTTVIPESFPESFLKDEPTKTQFNFETKFNFLVFGQITGTNPENDRKNLFYTLKWLCETFRDDQDVGVIVKTNHGRNTKIDRNVVQNLLTQLLNEVRPKGKGPAVYLVHGDMTDNEVKSLLTDPSVKAMISLTRGEGFGLPILEAAACGLPVIATNWSAHTEFLGLGRYIEIEHKLTEIHESRVDNKLFMKGSKWANPIEEAFKRKVKKFYGSHQTPKQWATELQVKIVEKYSHSAITALYDAEFKELLC